MVSASRTVLATAAAAHNQAANNTNGILKLQAQAQSQASSSSSSSSSRLSEPIKLTDAFRRRGINHKPCTPAIGEEFARDSIDLAHILQNDKDPEQDTLLRELATLVSHRGVVFIRNQSNLTPALLNKLAFKLGQLTGRPQASKLHIHPLSKDFSELGEYTGGEKIDSKPGEDGRQISFPDEKSELATAGWHTDISFEPVPSDYAMLQLRTIPECGGDTMWSSMYSAYDALSKPMQVFLEGLTATHDAEMFRDQASRYNFQLFAGPRGHPENVGTGLRTVHPIIRTNPVTGWKGLYVNKTFTKRINELSKDESETLLQHLFRHIADNFNYQVRYTWEEDDVAIWDNRSTNHSAIFDFGDARRTGDRACSLGERPYFDPNSKSRKQDLASQGRLY